MNGFELINNNVILNNLPLNFEGKELSSKLQAKLMIMSVTYKKSVALFQEKLQEIAQGLKPSGYDDLEAEIQNMVEIEKREKVYNEWDKEGEQPIKPSNEELSKAKDIRENKLVEYESKRKALIEKVNEAYSQFASDTVDISVKKLTEDEYSEVFDMIGSKGNIEYQTQQGEKIEIPRVEFLALIAANFVE